MSGLENLRDRLEFRGGITAENRFQKDKLKTLRKALLYSYQAETAILADGRMFRCLINNIKNQADYDVKQISIPYEDVCLGRVDKNGKEIKQKPKDKTSKGIEKIGMKCGDVFKWKETDTYWLVFLEKLEEDSYFRAEIYRCEEEVEINGKKYHIYIRGPVETEIQWNQKKSLEWNDLNYSLVIYITRDEDTLDFFHRFKQIKIGKRNWEVKTVNPYYGEGIIQVCLGEYFENELNDRYMEEQKQKELEAKQPTTAQVYIDGPKIVYPYEKYEYKIYGAEGGRWNIDQRKARVSNEEGSSTVVSFITGKSGKTTLTYTNQEKKVILPIEIRSI